MKDNNGGKTKQEICDKYNVSTRTFERFLASLGKEVGNPEGQSHEKRYSKEIENKFEKWLIKNQLAQGKETGVKSLINSIKVSVHTE